MGYGKVAVDPKPPAVVVGPSPGPTAHGSHPSLRVVLPNPNANAPSAPTLAAPIPPTASPEEIEVLAKECFPILERFLRYVAGFQKQPAMVEYANKYKNSAKEVEAMVSVLIMPFWPA